MVVDSQRATPVDEETEVSQVPTQVDEPNDNDVSGRFTWVMDGSDSNEVCVQDEPIDWPDSPEPASKRLEPESVSVS